MTISQDQVKDGVEATSVATEEEGGEEFSKVEKKGGFAGCPLRREVGKFAEQTLEWRLPRPQNIEGGFKTWAGGAPGVEGGEMAEC